MTDERLERSNRKANEAAARMRDEKKVIWAGNRWITNPDSAVEHWRVEVRLALQDIRTCYDERAEARLARLLDD